MLSIGATRRWQGGYDHGNIIVCVQKIYYNITQLPYIYKKLNSISVETLDISTKLYGVHISGTSPYINS